MVVLLKTGSGPEAVVCLCSGGESWTVANSLEEFLILWSEGQTGIYDLDDEECSDGHKKLAEWIASKNITAPKTKEFDLTAWMDGEPASPRIKKPKYHFFSATAVAKDIIYLSGARDSWDHEEDPHRSLLIDYNEKYPDPWVFTKIKWQNAAQLRFNDKTESFAVFMDREGQTVLFRIGGEGGLAEDISDAGLYRDDSAGYGHMAQLRQIGEHLYACGYGGQVYKREGPDHWVHMDKELLQKIDEQESLSPNDINGPHESAIYLVGSVFSAGMPAFLYFWNGKDWRKIEVPGAAGYLTCICVESESRIWLCGQNGTLLVGNADDGFKSFSTDDEDMDFLSVTVFEGKVYMGSTLEMYIFDPDRPGDGIRPFKTSLEPALKEVFFVEAKDGVLWVVGSKDLARFDGNEWKRIKLPLKPKIR
jgi:hypothetical protein